jgi:hypothetical protein
MTKAKLKDEQILIKATTEQKNQLKRLAELNKKNLSEYILDSSLSLTLDTAKMNFYQNINEDLLFLKRHLYITSQLILLLAKEQYKDTEMVKRYYKAAEEKADKILEEESR